jgi:NADH-quinone oxidoreductase subunit F
MITNRESLQRTRKVYENAIKQETKKILVCAGTGCVSSGSLEIYDRLIELMNAGSIPCSVELKEEPVNHGGKDMVGVKRSGCPGFCEMGPLLLIEPEGYLYTKVKLEDCEDIIERTIKAGEPAERLVYNKHGTSCLKGQDIPFYKKQTRLVLENCGKIDATSIKEYFAIGGYSAFEKALFSR